MATTYSPSLKLSLMGNGENSGTWGTITNNNWNLIENAVAGYSEITMSGSNYVLSHPNGDPTGEAYAAVIIVGGTGGYQVVAQSGVPKVYIVYNKTSTPITFGAATGDVATVYPGASTLVFSDGVNYYSGFTGSAGDFGVGGTLTAGDIVQTDLTANTALVADAGKSLSSSIVTSTELAQLSGINTSQTIQQQINAIIAGAGGVTSVGLVMPSGFNITGSPVTSSGTLNVAFASGLVGNPLYVNSSGSLTPITIKSPLTWNPLSGELSSSTSTSGITSISVATANGFAGASSGGVTPQLTIQTSVNGMVRGNGTALQAATAGTDYLAPGGSLGTPSGGNLANCTGYNAANLTGSITGVVYTTDFTGAGKQLLSSSGYQKLPGGVIIQWGYVGSAGNTLVSVSFPTSFTSWGSVTATANPSTAAYNASTVVANVSTSGFQIACAQNQPQRWVAIGY